MNTWFTSDWHIGDNRLDILRRPFKNYEEMFSKIRDQHNALVKPYDRVYVLGDVCFKSSPGYLPLIKTMNGKKILIKGNHDRNIPNKDFLLYFEEVIEDGDGLKINIEDLDLYLTHYPTTAQDDIFNLVGHVHDAWKFQANMINVGVDVNHFRPTSIAQIKFYYNAILQHFDSDIWASYLPQNVKHYETRGKKTSYFPKK